MGSVLDPTLAFLEQDTLLWATRNVVLHHGGPWDFSDRRWQLPILADDRPEQVFMKPTQVGMTTLAAVRALHFADYHQGIIIYTLPRQADVKDFTQLIIDPMLRNSPYLARRLSSDNVRVKQIGSGILMITESSVVPRMIPAQMVINDEWDLSDMEFVPQFRRRLDAAPIKRHLRLSVPLLPDMGIEVLFNHSTAAEWHFRCWHCGRWQSPDFEANIARPGRGHAYYKCAHCGRALEDENIHDGSWVQAHPDEEVAGYHISQLMLPRTHPAAEIIREHDTVHSIAHFYRNILGLPYSAHQIRLSLAQIKELCFQTHHARQVAPKPGGHYYIGIDQGNDIYMVVLQKVEDHLRLVHALILPFEGPDGFAALDLLLQLWAPKMAALDMLPNRHSARSLARRHKPCLWAAYYSDANMPGLYKEQEEEEEDQIIAINRTDVFDAMMERIVRGQLQLWGTAEPMEPDLAVVVQHLRALVRDEVTRRKPSGTSIYPVWRSAGADHFAHALGYAMVASQMRQTSNFRVSEILVSQAKPVPEQRLAFLGARRRSRLGQRGDGRPSLARHSHRT